MNVQAMLTALGDHGFADVGTLSKVRELQNAIWQIENAEPWPFLEASVDLNFDGSNPVPTNVPVRWRSSLRMKDLTTGRRVTYIRLDDFEDQVGTEYMKAGDPYLYYFEGGQLKVWPVPAASTGRVRWKYIRVSDPITDASTESDILIPPRHHDLIVLTALAKLYRMEDDLELAGWAMAEADRLLAGMRGDLLHQQFDRPDFVRVLDPDDWDDFTL